MTKQEINYGELTQELTVTLTKLQDSSLAVDEAVKLHTRGQEIIAQLETYLKTAENTVVKITSKE